MTFGEMVVGIQRQDPRALEEALRLYEPEMRRAIRHCLADPYLRRVCSESDIIQSVFLKVWEAPPDMVETTGPTELLGLLKLMVQRRVVDKVRKEKGRRATRGRLIPAPSAALAKAAAPGPGPLLEAEGRDQVRAIKERLRPDDRAVFELRVEQGLGWAEVAANLGRSAQALRKRYERALERAAGVADADLGDEPGRRRARPIGTRHGAGAIPEGRR
jgi:RNA polymerase sigma-70 factor (ECF subfamily)